MGACTECRAAKVKCDQVFPCSRCKKLNRQCIQHESRQGKGRGKNKRKLRDVPDESQPPPPRQRSPPRPQQQFSEDAALASGELFERAGASISPDHFGLNYLVRSWVSFAFRRRSFSLLSRAGSLASRCGISMDQVMCETESRRGMDFLYPILLTETTKQDVVDGELKPSKVPSTLWNTIDFNPDLAAAQNRWFYVREMYKGLTRFYCTLGFEIHVTTRSQMEETYQSNQKSVIDLFMIDRSAIVRGIAHQVAHNKSPGAVPKPCRQTGVKIRTVGAEDPVEVGLDMCLVIVSLDHAFFSVEFIPPEKTKKRKAATAPSAAAANSDLDNFELLDLGGLACDEELKIIYDLISG